MRPRIVMQVLAAAIAFGAALAAWLPFTALGGAADDAAAAVRAAIFGADDMSGAEVVVIALDERSVADPRLAGVPRALMSPVWAEVSARALEAGAEAVALDFILAFSAADLEIDGETPLRRYDTPFLKLLRNEGRAGRLVIARSQRLLPARRFTATAGAAGVAFVDLDADGDGVVRRVPTRFTEGDGAVALTLSGAILGAEAPREIAITPPAPLSALPAAALVDVLACDDPAALRRLFEGRAVFIGGALPGEDRFRAPDRYMTDAPVAAPAAPCDFAPPDVRGTGGDMPGVWLHAAAVDAERRGWSLAPAAPLVIALVAAAAAAAAGFAGLSLSPWLAAAIAVAIGAAGFGGAALAQEAGVLFPAARAGFAALVGFASGWLGRLLFLDRRERALRASFGRYVAPALVERILEQERLPELEGEMRPATIMFADLSGFTKLTEKLTRSGREEDLRKLTDTVNKYLSLIAKEVDASGGYVDKFIGDAVMAIWNAPAENPSHERDAVLAAARIRDAVDATAAADVEADPESPFFQIKIGVNSGPAIVGNVGDENRLNYTALGDTVNIAARMEGLPSSFLTPIVIGAACAAAAADDFAMLEIASIQVKGKDDPVAVFAPYPESARAFFGRYEAALAAYRAADFAAAGSAWRALSAEDWPGAALSGAMAGFADLIAATGAPPDWNGAVVMTSK